MKITENEAEILGIFAGDGNLYNRRVTIYADSLDKWFNIIGSNNPKNILKYKKWVGGEIAL